ncbi:MAG: hypothetical protein Ct9H300mP12_08820 [Acidimicrobiales bacterium]|nr:MAG: hypothetical protein Ct9H300mP12_08820 [Acidimicrobiales bacterium]
MPDAHPPVHGSAPNLTEVPRTLAIFSYRSEDSRILHPNHIPSVNEGEVVRGAPTGRIRATPYEMSLGEVPSTASFFDQQAQVTPGIELKELPFETDPVSAVGPGSD